MCEIIDLVSCRLKKEDIEEWEIIISNDYSERISIRRNPESHKLMIFIFTDSFERIDLLKNQALIDAKELVMKNKV
ncbi:MAG: hypothetical protein LUG49_05870 [Oscillospiraceae bacterium]|nr:hypothetical protein [Oscillospiraceae bacterium]